MPAGLAFYVFLRFGYKVQNILRGFFAAGIVVYLVTAVFVQLHLHVTAVTLQSFVNGLYALSVIAHRIVLAGDKQYGHIFSHILKPVRSVAKRIEFYKVVKRRKGKAEGAKRIGGVGGLDRVVFCEPLVFTAAGKTLIVTAERHILYKGGISALALKQSYYFYTLSLFV